MNYYVMIPGFLFENDCLTITDKVFVGLINGLSGETGYCYASNEKLAQYLGTTIPSVKNTISRLYAKDILENTGTKFDRKLVVKYIEKTPTEKNIKSQNDDFDQKTKSQIDTRKSQNKTRKSQIETSTLLYINKKKDNGQMTINDQTKSLDTSLSFLDWYNLYPKKVKKQRTLKLFSKLSKKDLNILLQATKLYITYKEENQEYFANPDTFLSQKVYLDFTDDIQQKQEEIKQTDETLLIATKLAKKILANEGVEFSQFELEIIDDSKATKDYAMQTTNAEFINFLKPYIKDRLC